MRYFIAVILPWLSFFTIGKPFSGLICLILQITLIGWPVAALWALFAVQNYWADRRNAELMDALRRDK